MMKRIRPIRIFSYQALFLLDILLYMVLKSYFLWMIAVIMVFFPFFSIGGLLRLARSLSIRVTASQDTVICGEELCLEIHIVNPRWYGALDSRILLKAANVFYGTGSEMAVSMPVRIHGESVLRMPVQVQDLGRFRIQCEQFTVQDILGILCCPVEVSADCEWCVYPQEKEGEDIEITEFLAGAAESEESHSKGSDFAEVSDIREYIAGDRIRDIHWKLSAKQDILMVKERIAMAGTELVILPLFSPHKGQTQDILEMVYGLGREFVRQQIPIRLLCWNQEMFAFEEYRCDTGAGLKKAFGEIFRTPVSLRLNEEQGQYIKNCYPYLGSYLIVGQRDGKVMVEMQENVL